MDEDKEGKDLLPHLTVEYELRVVDEGGTGAFTSGLAERDWGWDEPIYTLISGGDDSDGHSMSWSAWVELAHKIIDTDLKAKVAEHGD